MQSPNNTTPNPTAAIAWYRANRSHILSALPLTVGPATYTPVFCDCMDRWVAIADTLTPHMQECYICRPLRAIRASLLSPIAKPQQPAPDVLRDTQATDHPHAA